MRVLHTIGEMGTGGAESLVVELIRRGGEVGWHSDVASAGGRREDELAPTGLARFHRVPLSRRRPGGLLHAVRATRAVVRQADPDVVLAHNVGVTVATWLAIRSLRRRVPIATVFHGVAAGDYRASAMALSAAPGAVVTVSEVIRDRLLDAGLRRHTPVVISNAVSAPDLPDRTVARKELDLPLDVPVALCAARLVVQKRHDILLRAWAAVPEPAVLLLAGDGPLRARTCALAAELGLANRVRLLGARDDMPRLLAAADVCTLSSDWEGLPVALLEAMACGRPVVATGVDGVAEVLGHGGGLMVSPGDPSALAEALTALLGDPEATQRIGDEARRVIAEHHDPAIMVRSYDALLRSLIGRSDDRPEASPGVADEETTRS
jgi:glycosyltransferase involved in cell wall biosynthesis